MTTCHGSRYAWVVALGLVFCLLVTGPAGSARQPYRIGVLNEAWAANHPTVEGLKAGLRELGLQEGRHVTFHIRFTEGNPARMPAMAASLVDAGVDLIFTSHYAATKAAKEATAKIPIVFTLVADPVAAGVVTALMRPEGNVTGISSLQPELVAKRLEILKTLAPMVRRLWVIHHGADPSATSVVVKALEAGARAHLDVVSRGVLTAPELAATLRQVRRGDALLAPESSSLDIPTAILQTSLAARVPAAFTTALWVGHGGLFSYGPDYYAQGTQAAGVVAKILGGAEPRNIPVDASDKIDLAVNLKTAEVLGLTVPRKILLRADTFRR